MKIYLVSDLHVEFHKNFPLPESTVDIVVLAGDIHPGNKALDVARKYQEHCNAPVIFIAGNHEFYGCEYHKQLDAFRCEAAKLKQIHFLEKDAIVIDGVRFLGCTLWTNFALYGEHMTKISRPNAEQFIADFQVIEFNKRRFTSAHAISLFEDSYQWLDSQLALQFEGKTVVVTHFLPHRSGIHPLYLERGFDELTPYFTVDCSQLMQRYSISAWLYGHTHNSVDITVENGTRLLSNQRGYPHEKWTHTCFDSQKIIHI